MPTLADVPRLPGTDFDRCKLDIFRIGAAMHVAKALDIPVETAFSGVDLGKKADFTVAVPRFRLKAKPQDLVTKILDSVSTVTMSWEECDRPLILIHLVRTGRVDRASRRRRHLRQFLLPPFHSRTTNIRPNT